MRKPIVTHHPRVHSIEFIIREGDLLSNQSYAYNLIKKMEDDNKKILQETHRYDALMRLHRIIVTYRNPIVRGSKYMRHPCRTRR
jgi:hypothetical protein